MSATTSADPAYRLAIADAQKARRLAAIGLIVGLTGVIIGVVAVVIAVKSRSPLSIEDNVITLGSPSGSHVMMGPGGIRFMRGEQIQVAITSTSKIRCFEVYDAEGNTRLVMGNAELTNNNQGGHQITPESRITGFDLKGGKLPADEVIP
jgi:hypothetical protein